MATKKLIGTLDYSRVLTSSLICTILHLSFKITYEDKNGRFRMGKLRALYDYLKGIDIPDEARPLLVTIEKKNNTIHINLSPPKAQT